MLYINHFSNRIISKINLILLGCRYLPESLQWLEKKDKSTEWRNTLDRIARINHVQLTKIEFKVSQSIFYL